MVKQEKGSHQKYKYTVQIDLFKTVTKKHNKIEIILRIINALLKIR